MIRFLISFCLLAALAVAPVHAASGFTVLPASDSHGPITLFYPSPAKTAALQRGVFSLDVAVDGAPERGNGRLVIISHGSGGAPWPLSDLAATLVKAGFVVAMPEHEGDNYHDMRLEGPESWKRRPAEVSAAIDALKADARFGPLLKLDRVGVYGTSAGGLNALILAGARWSPANFMRHCLAHMEQDFPACVGLFTRLKGTWSDGIKTTLARWVHRIRFNDETFYSHEDSRIKAVIASVPMAAPIDMASLAHPKAVLALMEARQDQWLAPRFHIEAVRAACPSCELLADLPNAGHGSLFSPWPADLAQRLTPMLLDPPGFDRSALPAIYESMANFFLKNLLP